ncbi:tRNA (adenosine(37)-N6)-dimethylallyltransferase MiaA [Bacillus coahuilensis]|uniref:tRNA (adenosine(37)-N6)-dimethylallyltransferase MiaA n=1 Tax=Bacillus coahuilensis TaxID=408580 RepID=UPI0023AAB24C|nr:tRNA (adenosine(37)-N6)-dimethylallyltransferase MiaA [Bacillus coahuilensis]
MSTLTKEKLLVIIGPTAVGKTELSIEVAKNYNGEIISGDSMQIYKGMDIGTAKIKEEEMQGIPHHLIDIRDPSESFSVAEFQKEVRTKIKEITSRGKLPIIVGGTGLYIQSVLFDYQFSEEPSNHPIRESLELRLQEQGIDPLFRELEQLDPASARNIHPNNYRRVVRALEVYHTTGKTMSEHQANQLKDPLYDVTLIGLTMDRERLYERINYRVDLMMEEGLLEEVTRLYEAGVEGVQSIQAIGYKEIYDYLEGRATLEDAISTLKQNSRRYAKRQLTWFHNKMDVHWFDVTKLSNREKNEIISSFLAGKL